jgi:hypothetical protein
MSQRWYDFLTGNKWESLLTSSVDLNTELFVGRQYKTAKGETKYKYTSFYSHQALWDHLLKLDNHERTFNEVAPALRAQKLRFDIDMEGQYNVPLAFKIIGYIIAATAYVLLPYNVILNIEKDVLIFNSNSKTKPKTSYHIIIDNYCFSNFLVIEFIANKIFEYIPSEYLEYLDRGVYTRNHMLRIYRNCKVGEALRIKRLTRKFMYRKIPIETVIPFKETPELDSDFDFYVFEHSLITWTFYCAKVPVILPLPPTKEITVTDKGIEYAISVFQKLDKENIFTVDEARMESNFIPLKRACPSLCMVCDRIHESDNASVLIFGKNIYFKCWRNTDKRKIGSLDNPDYIESDDESAGNSENDESEDEENKGFERPRFEMLNTMRKLTEMTI